MKEKVVLIGILVVLLGFMIGRMDVGETQAESPEIKQEKYSDTSIIDIVLEELNEKIEKGKLKNGVYRVDVSAISDGASFYYEGDKIIEERTYKDGKKEGLIKRYRNGKLQDEFYLKNGRPDGVGKSYYLSGGLRQEGTWKNGRRDGVVKSYYRGGVLKYAWKLEEGKEIYEKWYYNSGKLREERTYDDEGELYSQKFYYKDGSLKSEYDKDTGFVNLTTDRMGP